MWRKGRKAEQNPRKKPPKGRSGDAHGDGLVALHGRAVPGRPGLRLRAEPGARPVDADDVGAGDGDAQAPTALNTERTENGRHGEGS